MKQQWKQKRWVVAVSGGCDSMYLLDTLRKSGYDLVCAHVNYGIRERAQWETNLVQTYCVKFAIPLEITYAPSMEQGNFQAKAREFRYRFFRDVVHDYACAGVMVAHHEDDVLETYLMQKQKELIPLTYGVAETSNQDGLCIVRPLLGIDKKMIRKTCEDEKIPYLDDDSNEKLSYERNRLRHQIVAHLTRDERMAMLEEINRKNSEKQQREAKAKAWLEQTAPFTLQALRALTITEQKEVLICCLLEQHVYNIKQQKLDDLLKLCNKDKNWVYQLDATKQLCNDYGVLSIQPIDVEPYAYRMESITLLQTPFFAIQTVGGACEHATLQPEDFPIMIRSPQPDDEIVLRYGTKKLNRWFIDRKISHNERKLWPVVVNSMGKIILVPGIGCDISHYSYQPNLFVVKCT
ncbi:MAG: tRNA lysidine(34) synthetase TilS [Erysipelotrichaceae bacterium]